MRQILSRCQSSQGGVRQPIHRLHNSQQCRIVIGKKYCNLTTTTTALALLLINSTATHAFSTQHRFDKTCQARCFGTTSSLSLATSFDGLDDLDASKLPRLFVGNWDRTRRISSQQGIRVALQDQPMTTKESCSVSLAQDALIPLKPDQSHYLTTVLRLGKKSRAVPYARLFDDNGEEWLAKIVVPVGSKRPSRNGDPLQAVCVQRIRGSQQGTPVKGRCWLVVAPTKKKERLRWMIEKCTELNVEGFVLLDTEYSETSSTPMSKLQAYAVEAAEQSERLSVPTFLLIQPKDEEDTHNNDRRESDDDLSTTLEDFVAAWQADKQKVSLAICRERSDRAVPLREYLSSQLPSSNPQNFSRVVAFVVGPEGGWSPAETAMFDSLMTSFESFDIQSVSLGSTILRSETACMLAIGAFALEADAPEKPTRD